MVEAQNVESYAKDDKGNDILTTEVSETEKRYMMELGQTLTNGNQVCMKIKNLTNLSMTNGYVATSSGIIYTVLPKTIQPNSFHCIGFEKTTPLMPRGAVGVVAYDIGNDKLCIRYSNPFIGTNKGGFLWVFKSKEMDSDFTDVIEVDGVNFEGYGTMKWASSPSESGEFIAEGFVT